MKKDRLTRREFLGALPLAIAVGSACRRTPYRPEEFRLPARSAVGLFSAPHNGVDLGDVISRGLEILRPDVRGRRALLKPNLVEYDSGTAINTNALLVATGLYDQLKDLRVRFVDLNHDDVRPTRLRSQFMGLSELSLPVELLKSDFIVSLPKLKTHHWVGMTASMKNFFGVVPGAVYGWPKNLLHLHGIDNAILDLNSTIKPHFTIVDAVVGMEGDGPIMGRPRPTGFLAMGTDLVSVDATCARIIGLDPARLPSLSMAFRFLGNLSPDRIDQLGEAPALASRLASTWSTR